MSDGIKTVKVVVYVNEIECASAENDVPERFVNKVLGAACAVVENADEMEDES